MLCEKLKLRIRKCIGKHTWNYIQTSTKNFGEAKKKREKLFAMELVRTDGGRSARCRLLFGGRF